MRFSNLFADTIETHGVVWAYKHYRKRMSEFEFGCWFRSWSGRLWEGIDYYN
jgi:hypothetical protein